MEPRRYLLWFLFIPAALVGIGLFFVPAYIIRPFHHQTPGALALAMHWRQFAPLGTLAASLLCLVLAILLWGTADRARRIILASVMVVVAFSAVMSRLNYFEWMFHPVRDARFEAESASKLGGGEMIL